MIRKERGCTPVSLEQILDETAERFDDAHEQYLNLMLAQCDPMNYALGTLPGIDHELLPY